MKAKQTNQNPDKIFLPTEIKIGYQTIEIESFEFGDDIQGSYNRDVPRIRVSSSLSDVEVLNTVIHESLHACVYVYGLKSFFKDDEEEEKLVTTLGNALTELFVRNPSLIELWKAVVNG